VGLIDTGFDWEHPDLGPGEDSYDNIYLNEKSSLHQNGEDPWSSWDDPNSGNSLDDDGNGYIDDWKGWGEMYSSYHYFLGNDVRNYDYQWLYQQYADDAEALWMHGTFIAGIIGAKTNNDEGIAGIAGGWSGKGASLLLFKTGISDHNGSYTQRVAIGIDYLVNALGDQRASIIEMPFVTHDTPDGIISSAIVDAYNKGVFMVAASGNFDQGGSSAVGFPANHPDVFAVGATDNIDHRKSNSCYGSELDLGAPGSQIPGLIPYDDKNYPYQYDNGYIETDGNTSAASAMVAGTAALMLSENPELSNVDIKNILHESADKGTYYTYVNGHNDEIGFGRLNTLRAVCMAKDYEEDVEINSNVTWDEDLMQMNAVIVKSGYTLTITANIQFGPEAPLIIEPGACVEINGGTLTNLKCCHLENNKWPGIQVWGNANASQETTPTPQGKLIMQNGATIENAVTAVDLWKPGDYSKTGGIIDADDSYFLNNTRSVHASDYRNFNPFNTNQELDYHGSFNNCLFILNGDYLDDQTFYKHVDLCHVRGLKFYGCSFSLSPEAENVSQWNLGIAAYDAGFSALPVCKTPSIPCIEYNKCHFDGFYWGIGVYSSDRTSYPVFVNNCEFENNNTGAYISAASNSVLINNEFIVGYNSGYPYEGAYPTGIGIDVDHGHGFVIENNIFNKNMEADSGVYAGVRVASCPSAHDIIYRNAFFGLSYGNYAEGTNRSAPGDDATGVEYLCNYNQQNAVDFMVTDPEPRNAMIRGSQGSSDTACGNLFSKYQNSWDVRNEGTQTINWYYYNTSAQDPTHVFTIDPIYFEKYTVDDANDCPDHYGGEGHITLNQEERQEFESAYVLNLNDYYSVTELYQLMIDGGNTEAMLSDIQNAEPDDMWDLRVQLLGDSPHLSQQSLRATALRTDVFPDNVLLEILSANPDELDRDTLLQFLEEKEDPLPAYMLDILREAAQGITYKTILQDDMSRYFAGKTQAAQDIIRSILFDSVFVVDDYRNWLDNLGGLESDKEIVSSYLYQHDTSNAIYLLNLIPSNYGLTGSDLEDFNEYKAMMMMQIGWMAEGKTIFDLDSIEIAELESIALDQENSAYPIARNILRYAYNYHFPHLLEDIDSNITKSQPVTTVNSINETFSLSISAKPNPADSWVVLDYALTNTQSQGVIIITDITGRLVQEFKVQGLNGQQIWDTRKVSPGLYNCTIMESGLFRFGKIIIL
jgi:hypothetical protein